MECNNGIVIPQLIEDPCNGKTTKASCVRDPTVYPEYSLSENSSQQQINQATYLSIQNLSNSASPTPVDGSETKVTAGLGITVTGDGTEAAPYVVNAPPVIDKTYTELTTMVANNELVPGQTYLLTDYMTTYIQPVTNIYMESGVIEPLLLTAVSTNKFHTVCKSQLYPQDIIYYEISAILPNDTRHYNIEDEIVLGTEGFTKGKIYRRIDTLYNNDVGTDWRHIKYRRDSEDYLMFEGGTRDNKIEAYFLTDTVFFSACFGNTIASGTEFYGNTANSYFIDNTIKRPFVGNTVYDFSSNIITSNAFGRNILLNEFSSNNINFWMSSQSPENSVTNNVWSTQDILNLSIDTSGAGQRFFVRDALNPVFGQPLVGGGTVFTPVYFNGSSGWIVG